MDIEKGLFGNESETQLYVQIFHEWRAQDYEFKAAARIREQHYYMAKKQKTNLQQLDLCINGEGLKVSNNLPLESLQVTCHWKLIIL